MKQNIKKNTSPFLTFLSNQPKFNNNYFTTDLFFQYEYIFFKILIFVFGKQLSISDFHVLCVDNRSIKQSLIKHTEKLNIMYYKLFNDLYIINIDNLEYLTVKIK